jgi:hypothetical protein
MGNGKGSGKVRKYRLRLEVLGQSQRQRAGVRWKEESSERCRVRFPIGSAAAPQRAGALMDRANGGAVGTAAGGALRRRADERRERSQQEEKQEKGP